MKHIRHLAFLSINGHVQHVFLLSSVHLLNVAHTVLCPCRFYVTNSPSTFLLFFMVPIIRCCCCCFCC